MNLDTELYLTTDEIKFEIEHIDGLKMISESEDFIETVDNFDGNNRHIRFNKESFIFKDDIIESFGNNVDQYGILDFLHVLPKILLMNIRKIYVVSTKEDIARLEDEIGIYGFDLWNKGMYDWENSNVVISLLPHEHDVENIEGDVEIDMEYMENVRLSIWKTITCELFRSLQSNPLFEGEIEQGEVVVEDFCTMFFQPSRAIAIDEVQY
jgi:hypothetical protein